MAPLEARPLLALDNVDVDPVTGIRCGPLVGTGGVGDARWGFLDGEVRVSETDLARTGDLVGEEPAGGLGAKVIFKYLRAISGRLAAKLKYTI